MEHDQSNYIELFWLNLCAIFSPRHALVLENLTKIIQHL